MNLTIDITKSAQHGKTFPHPPVHNMRPVRGVYAPMWAQFSPSSAQVILPVCQPKPPVPHDLSKIEFLMPGEKLPCEVYFFAKSRKRLVNTPLSTFNFQLLTASYGSRSATSSAISFTTGPVPTVDFAVSNICIQNGQPVATTSAPVAVAS